MGADGMPDDNLEAENGGCGTNVRFPDSLTADIEGENDHESMGTLTVYNGRLSDADEMVKLSVKGITSPAEEAKAVELSQYAEGVTQETAGTNDISSNVTSTAPIIWASGTVTVKATVSEDASYTVKIGAKSFAVHATRGATVELPYYATDAAGAVAGNEPAEHDRH